MKSDIYSLRSLAMALCLTASLSALAQTPKKPRIQTSAAPTETVYKAQGDAGAKTSTPQAKENARTSAAAPKSAEKRQATLSEAGSRYIALKTNLAMDVFAIQNLAIEVQFHKHITVELPLIWSFWDIEQEHGIRTFTLQPEARWWLKEAGTGHFFGLHANVSWFNVKWNENRYQSAGRPLLGAGLSYGYKLPLSEHWGAEFTLGAGYANMKYDTYYNIVNGAKIDTRSRNYWGITRVGLSLVYRF